MSAAQRAALAAAAAAAVLIGVLLALAFPAPVPAPRAAREDLPPGELAALQEEARAIAKDAAGGTR